MKLKTMTETPKQKRAASTYTTLKNVASDTRFAEAMEKIKQGQHDILVNGWYDYTKID